MVDVFRRADETATDTTAGRGGDGDGNQGRAKRVASIIFTIFTKINYFALNSRSNYVTRFTFSRANVIC